HHLRRACMVLLFAEMSGKPMRLHVNERQMPLVRDLGIDKLLTVTMSPRASVFDSDTGRFTKDHVAELFEQGKEDSLPANVLNQRYEQFGRGSFTHKLRGSERKLPPGATSPSDSQIMQANAPPPVYNGPDRRTEDRFSVESAEVSARIGGE